MKKIFSLVGILVFIFTSLSLLSNRVSAQELNWKKYPFNPIITPGVANSWDSEGKSSPSVIFDENKFKMWFTGYDGHVDKIGYATSDDGIKWQIYLDNPILSPQPEELHYSDPSVIHDEEGYKIWLTVQNSNGSYVIKTATSINGISWSNPTPIITTKEWESTTNMNQPSVIKKDGQYLMWYSSVENDQWKIGFATSENGLSWSKHPTPVINSADAPNVIFLDNHFEAYYHTGNPIVIEYATSFDGISWTKPENNPILYSDPLGFDSVYLAHPSVITAANSSLLYLWFTGYNGQVWSIGYATTGSFPSGLSPVILIPGLFASWNSQAIIEGADPAQDQWIMSPFVKDYQGIIDTLKSLGYSDDLNDPQQNLFVFNYDWRDRVEDTATVLNDYINQKVLTKNPDKKIYLTGHSLGGLISRVYVQSYGNDNIEKFITLGSPLSGGIQAYKAWEGGVVENNNLWEKLAVEVILGLHRNGFRTNKDLIRELLPVTHDLLPTFDYLLKKNNGQLISQNSMVHKNSWLTNLEADFPAIYDNFYAIYGKTGLTPEMYEVSNASFLEKMLGLWEDGKPLNTLTSNLGDEVVLFKSATRSADPASLVENVSHRNLVSNPLAIEELMNVLDLEPEAIITPPPSPPVLPALFFAIHSPAKFTINGPSGIFDSGNNAYVLIQNAINGTYQINIEGQADGNYNFDIGQLTADKSLWSTIYRQTQQAKLDQFNLTFNSVNPLTNPLSDPLGSVYFDNAYQLITNLKNSYSYWSLTLALNSLDKAKIKIEAKKYKEAGLLIKKAIDNLYLFRKKHDSAEIQNITYSAMRDLSAAYNQIQKLGNIPVNKTLLLTDINLTSILKETMLAKLKMTPNEQKAISYTLGEQMLDSARQNFQLGNYYQSEIDLFLAKLLLSEV